MSYALCIHWHLSVKLLFSTFKIRHCQNVMEDQEHKISSYIEQQEDMKSMVSSLRGCATTSWMNISELLLYFVVIKWVEGRPGSIWHCQLAERYWLLLFCYLPFLFVVSSLLRGAVPFFPALFVPYTSHKETFLIVLYIKKFSEKCARHHWSERVHYISTKHVPYITRLHCWDIMQAVYVISTSARHSLYIL